MFYPQMSAECYVSVLWGFSQECLESALQTFFIYLFIFRTEFELQKPKALLRKGRGVGIITPLSALKEGPLLNKTEVSLPLLFPQVCELVKFMIEHCQQILGEDPSSLYGGPPPQPPPEETGSGNNPVGRDFTQAFLKRKKYVRQQRSWMLPLQSGATR